jgi:hypothetical protein
MGTTCTIVKVADWISIVGIVVNSVLAWWIVRTIQNRLTNKRVLKDHFIGEIKEVRAEYKNFLNNLYANKAAVSSVIPWFKLMNIKVADLMELINKKYLVEKSKLNPYQTTLRELITENEDFIKYFKEEVVEFSENSKQQIIIFQQTHNHLFNEIIMLINDKD